jgi:endonuclease YncB( thermonuclease family)
MTILTFGLCGQKSLVVERDLFGEAWLMVDLVTEFSVFFHSAIDGDTLKLIVDFSAAPKLAIIGRLDGIMAPELGLRDRPNLDGYAAKAALLQWFSERQDQILTAQFHGRDKYGRSLVRIVDAKGQSLNDYLLKTGHAVVYHP